MITLTDEEQAQVIQIIHELRDFIDGAGCLTEGELEQWNGNKEDEVPGLEQESAAVIDLLSRQ